MPNMLFVVPNSYHNNALAGGHAQQNYRRAVLITSFGTDFPEGRCDAIGIEWTAASGGSVTAFAAGSLVKIGVSPFSTSVTLTPASLTQANTAGRTAVIQVSLNRLGTPTATGANFYALYL